MMIEDPSGLLQRIPELRALCEDAKVRRAVERGDPFKVYRALMWARWLGRLRSHREVLDTLLRRRRLFARPLKGKSLFLGTLNGFGATMLGDAEPDPHDGTSIATHALVALFVLPLLPLGAYVVRPGEGSGPMSRSWTFFARVPLGTLPWMWSRAVALSVIALVATGAARAFHASLYRDVYVANGFEEPLTVTLGGTTQEVPSRQVATITVPMGTQPVHAVTRGGAEVDATELNVTSHPGVLAWNIAGAMPLYLARVVYSERSNPDASGEKPTVFCGQRVVELGEVDYVFKEPPDTLSIPKGSSHVARSQLGIAMPEEPPLQVCFKYLAQNDKLGQALPFTEAEARMSGWAGEQASLAFQAAIAAGPPEAARVAKAWRDARPDDSDNHRTYQWAAQRNGQLEAITAEYAERAGAAPDSPTAQYLHARLLRGAEGLRAMEQHVARFPKDANLLRAVTHGRYLAGDWEGTTRSFSQLRAENEKDAAEVLGAQTTALVALGRSEEALELLKQFFKSDHPRTRATSAELYALVTAHMGQGHPDALVAALESEGKDEGEEFDWLRVRAGLPVKAEPEQPGTRLMQLIGKDPKAALAVAPRVAMYELIRLSGEAWALAYGEAVRTGAADSERALAGAPFLQPEDLDGFRRFIRGESGSLDMSELTPDLRAAAYFLRSRNAVLPEGERKRLVEQARREDWLHGPVSEAISSWSP
ncbi:hypothetical protein [Pyxidicoccus sp. MSG2]|uniref:hypothetical protein n=1 Tax=Pyxidicoccus sp. MSG2 TaxID=2996790 RepID=UPI002270111A|nr:hypothetical protein [Pyxidicoccus sp. MSG2]MCY1018345.1 hypothetical protein [Pyxidicoccus sp. MSG2]